MATGLGGACIQDLLVQVENLENGYAPFPMVYRDSDCSIQDLNSIGGGRFPGINDDIDLSSTTQSWKNQLCQPLTFSIALCPIPRIKQIFIPPGVEMTFKHNDAQDQYIYRPGEFVLQSTTPGVTNNFFTVVEDALSAPKWGSALSVGNNPEKNDQCPAFSSPGQYLYDPATGKINRSIVSCGSPFWPSFWNVVNDVNGRVGLQDDFNWRAANPCFYQKENNELPVSQPLGAFAFGDKPCTAADGKNQQLPMTYSDCVTNLFNTNPNINLRQYLCGCYKGNDDCESGDYTKCQCGDPTGTGGTAFAGPLLGSVKSIDVGIIHGRTWSYFQLQYCLGLDRLIVGGIPVVGPYSQGSILCDNLVEEYCLNSANQSDSNFFKYCSCILSEQKIKQQYAGLDLPVQCFASECSDSDPLVYKTAAQLKTCNASVCQQVVNIHGDQISAQGQQTLVCDGQLYNISSQSSSSSTSINSAQGNVSGDPSNFLNNASLGGTGNKSNSFSVGSMFWVALGILLLLVFLLILWGIRFAVLKARHNRETRIREEEVFFKLLKQRKQFRPEEN